MVLAAGLGIRSIFFAAFSGASKTGSSSQITDASDQSDQSDDPSKAQTADQSVRLTATGDILLEDALLDYFGNGDWKGYMDQLTPLFEADDFTLANLEVPIAGETLGITGADYSFNAPDITAQNIKKNGIDFVTLANNHAYDRGIEGIVRTRQNLINAGVGFTGTAPNPQEKDENTIVEVNGLKIALISYTYDTNQPVDLAYYVNIYGSAWDSRSDQVVEEVKKARSQADAVIVCMHWGDEFTTEINKDQQVMASALADAGADLIIGNHPHCIQPAQWLETADGRQVLCFYSLGNLASSAVQVDRASEEYQNLYEAGAIVQLKLSKGDTGKIQIEDPKIIPVVNHFEDDYGTFEIIPLKAYTEEKSKQHDQARYSDQFSASWLRQKMGEVFGPSTLAVEQ